MNKVDWEPIIEGSLTKVPLSYFGGFALIDTEDLDKVRHARWHADEKGYVKCQLNRKTLRMHRIIMDAPKGMDVDHINHDPRDCRKSNLRVCSRSQNQCNSVTRRSKTGVKGVGIKKNHKYKRFCASIQINHKSHHLGYFSTLEEAIAVRKQAELTYHGDYQYNAQDFGPLLNSVNPNYQQG
jgi:hypothetical protein